MSGVPLGGAPAAPVARRLTAAEVPLEVKMICIAMKSGQAGAAARLLSLGIPADQLIHDEPLLLSAVAGGNLENCRVLLDAGAEIDRIVSGNPVSALQISARRGNAELVRLLIEYGCDVNLVSRKGRPALHLAAEFGHVEVCDLLLDAGADVNLRVPIKPGDSALILAAKWGRAEVCDRLCAGGADVSVMNDDGQSALHCAASYGAVAACRVLVEAGADVKALAKPRAGRRAGWPLYTSFQNAVRAGSIPVVRYFVEELGEDPEQLTSAGLNMLQLAGSKVQLKKLLRALSVENAIGAAVGEVAVGSRAAPPNRSSSTLAL